MNERAVRKVYAVSSGEYSDYKVLWLFERKEDAEANAKTMGEIERGEAAYGDVYPGSTFVESFYLYGPGEQPRLVSEWEVQVDLPVDPAVIPELNRPWEHKVLEESAYPRPELQQWKTQLGTTSIRGRGANREAVIKAVKDRAASVIASPGGTA